MSKSFSEKTSGLFVTLFIGLIVISFVVTGYQGGQQGGSGTIAKVGDYNVSIAEFQNVYERQLAFYRQVYGGKDLTSQQIKQMKLRDNIVQQLINQKLILIFGDQVGNYVSSSEVKDSIINYAQNGEKIFQTGGKFNVAIYKSALQRAGIPISKFEEDNRSMLQGKKVFNLVSNFPLSNNFISDVVEFRKNAVKATVVQISQPSLQPFVKVSDSEIKTFLDKKENVDLTKARYEVRKNMFARPEEINASHILLIAKPGEEKKAEKEINRLAKKVNAKNFAKMANKYGDGAKNKNGGDLGWFGKGRMVKAFDSVVFKQKIGTISKPVKTPFGWHLIYVKNKRPAVVPTFADFKEKVAKQIIQEGKQGEILKIAKNLEKKIKGLLNANKFSAIAKLQKEYKFSYEKDWSINQFDGTGGKLVLSGEKLNKVFTDTTGKPLVFLEGNYLTIIKAKKDYSKVNDEQDVEKTVVDTLKQSMGQIFTTDITNQMRTKTDIKVFKFY